MFEDKLLIIEDDKHSAQRIERIAMEAGFETRVSLNNLAFIAIFETFKPDVLIMDILMPGMDGFEILQFLHGRGSDVLIVILSTDTYLREMAEKFAEGLKLSVVMALPTPYKDNELRLALKEIRFSLPNRQIDTPIAKSAS